MNTLDELFIRAKNLASAAGSKAQEVAEMAKLRLQATQLRSDLDSNYLKLGEIIYELKTANAENNELIEMCVAEIEAQNQELDELNMKINQMRNVVKCPACMNDNPVGALFCSRCGAALTDQPKADVIICETIHVQENGEESACGEQCACGEQYCQAGCQCGETVPEATPESADKTE